MSENKYTANSPQKVKPNKCTVMLAIKGSGGIIQTIADRCECSWGKVRSFIDKHEDLSKMYQDERNKFLDACESVIMDDIVNRHDVQTAKWYLARQAKDRGFGDHIQQEVSSQKAIQIMLDPNAAAEHDQLENKDESDRIIPTEISEELQEQEVDPHFEDSGESGYR